jgi:major membrane immunogen (membrane-anchored lipoprotein)
MALTKAKRVGKIAGGLGALALLGGCASLAEKTEMNRQIDRMLKAYEARKPFDESRWQEGVTTTEKGYEIVAHVKNYSDRKISIWKAESEARDRLADYLGGDVGYSEFKVLERMFGSDGVTVRMYVPYEKVVVGRLE